MRKPRASSLTVKFTFPAKTVDESAQSSTGSQKSRSTLWRERLREQNPEKYEELMENDRQRKKADYIREVLDDSRIGRYKRKSKLETKLAQQRQRRRNTKQYEAGSASSHQPTSGTNSGATATGTSSGRDTCAKERRNRYMQEYMRNRRAAMSRQKKKATNEKDRKRKASTTMQHDESETGPQNATKCMKQSNCQEVLPNSPVLPMSPILPNSPEKFADVIYSILDTSTPRKVKALKKLGIPATKEERKRNSLMDKLGDEAHNLSTSCKKKKTNQSKTTQRSLNQIVANIVRKKYGYTNDVTGKETRHSWNYASKCFGINWRQKRKTAAFSARKKREDAVPDLVQTKVADFYKSPQVSQTRPDKKLGKSGQPTYIMHLTYKKAYQLWMKENPTMKLGFTKFYSLKPKNVKTMSFAQHIGCLCVYCVNIQEKLKAIDYKIRSMQKEEELKKSRISDEKELYNMLLCEKSDANRFQNPQCVNGSCEKCSALGETISTFYNPFMEEAKDDQISWKKWETKKVKYPKKEGGKVVEKEASRRVLTIKEGTANELIGELICDVVSPTRGTSFITHLFNATWQIYQVEKILKEAVKKQTVPGIVMIIQDFGRNFSAKYQDEIKSAHWMKKDVTVHPMVAYYVDPATGRFTRDSLVMLSDDLTHDHHIVEHFQNVAHNHLKNVRGLDIQLLVQINDGCANQYKKAAAFADVSFSVQEYGYVIERGYYGSEHGKGESDGETSVVKGQSEKAILSRKTVIDNAETMYEFCKENLSLEGEDKGTHQSRRSFFLIEKGDVNRSRPERCEGLRAVPNTRKLHSVRSIQAPFAMKKKQLSCFCTHCLQDETEKCSNTAYTGEWCDVNLKPGKKSRTRKPRKQEDNEKRGMQHVTSGSKQQDHKKKMKPTDGGSKQKDHKKTTKLTDGGPKQQDHKKTTKLTDGGPNQGEEKKTVNVAEQRIDVNDYVAIHFESFNRATKGLVFMALVTAVRNDHAQVKFMRRNNSGLYNFTEEPEALHPNSDVVLKMTQPIITQATRAYLYKFIEEELVMLSDKYSLK